MCFTPVLTCHLHFGCAVQPPLARVTPCSGGGNQGKLLEPLRNTKGKTDHLDKNVAHVIMEETSLVNRMALVRGFKALDQVEYMYLVTASGLNVPERKREAYGGSNRGNVISQVALRPLNEGWSATFKMKKLIYGKNRRAVGGAAGPSDAASGDEGSAGSTAASSLRPPTVDGPGAGKDRTDDAVEPVFYRVLPPLFYHCLLTSMSAKAVVDCTAGDGSAALSAIESKIPYVGICMTPEHMHGLTGYLATAVLDKFVDERSAIYQPKLADLQSPLGQRGSVASQRPGSGAPRKPTAKRGASPRRKADAEEGSSSSPEAKRKRPSRKRVPKKKAGVSADEDGEGSSGGSST